MTDTPSDAGLDLGRGRTSPTSADRERVELGRPRARRRPAARGMRRLRHLRASGRGRDHRARPACPPASRPRGGGHRLVRRQEVPFRAAHGPGRRQLLPPGGDRAPARHVGDGPRALFDHRRDHPAQRAAAVRRARRRRLGHRPQRQSDQRPDPAPPAGARRRHHAVDLRHRGHPASRRATPSATASSTVSSRGCVSSKAPMRSSASPTRSSSARATRSASVRW